MNKGNILLSLLIVLFLGASAFLLGNASVSQATGNHNEWGEWEYSDWGSCEAVNECGSEGVQYATRTRTCEEVGGHGEDECEIEKEKVWDYWWCTRSGCPWHWEYTPETQEEQIEQSCQLEEYEACEVPEEPKEPEQPQPSEPVAGNVQPASPPPPNQCSEGEQAPQTPVLGQLTRIDADTVFIGWQKASDVDHYVLSYGRSYEDMPYGLPYVNGDSEGVELDGVWSDGH